ncbi:Dbl homology domain-containing protein [Amylostereum chailletii]|nr:Dbl homology domain-containing protein [Amylostereum chailletii]
MSASIAAHHVDKALPSPIDALISDLSHPPPPTPPKYALPTDHANHQKRVPTLPPIDASTSFDSLDPNRDGPNLLATSPASSSFPDGRAKKLNPLVDLIESEKVYVDQLSGIIRKVAAAWSRSNLPPRELDLMFRSLEAVYKTNKQLLARLKEIGTNPSSPKALGDLLMKWIDDLEAPYTTYCERYCTGFDDWEPVRSNDRLPVTLSAFSVSNPPPLPSHADPHTSEPPLWTLDDLFILPKGRLKYYKKLYGRLLKATQPGKSDYKLLLGASDKLEKLLAMVDTRSKITPSGLPPPPPKTHMATEDEVVVDFRTQRDSSKLQSPTTNEGTTSSETSSARGSGLSSGVRGSEETSATSVHGSTPTRQIPITDLEHRLSVDRCLDIFTMTPKTVKLQMFPPNLPFVREMRLAVDVSMRMVPRSTGVEVFHQQGRIFLLSDLFLACEAMTPQERAEQPSEADMWLLYPPLAGKFLKVQAVEGSDTMLQVTVMRKEKLMVEVDSPQLRDKLLAEFQECIEFATTMYRQSMPRASTLFLLCPKVASHRPKPRRICNAVLPVQDHFLPRRTDPRLRERCRARERSPHLASAHPDLTVGAAHPCRRSR